MAAAAWQGGMYLFGGVGANNLSESILDVSDELWHWCARDGVWTQVARQGDWPSARRCVGWVAHGGFLWLYGGSGVCETPSGDLRYTFLNDLWRFDPRTGCWMCLRVSDDHRQAPSAAPDGCVVPVPRYTPVWQPVGEEMLLFGGYTEDLLGKRKLNDAWLFGEFGWRQVPPQEPAGYQPGSRWPGVRYGCMSANDGSRAYICGGFADDGDHNDVWRFDPQRQAWELMSCDTTSPSAPSPRYCAAFAYYDNALYLFGGRSRRYPKQNFNDLWRFDFTSCAWHQLSPHREPHCYQGSEGFPGYHAKSASTVVGTSWYIWGGEGLHGHVSDLWQFNFLAHEWRLVQPARADDPVFW